MEEVAKALADTRYQLERLEDARARGRRGGPAPTAGRADESAAADLSGGARAVTATVQPRSIRPLPSSRLRCESLAVSTSESLTRRDEAVEAQRRLLTQRESLEEERKELARAADGSSDTGRRAPRGSAQAIAIKVESRRSSKESASAALLRVQSQLAHLSKRQHELQAEIANGRALVARGRAIAGHEVSMNACSSRRISPRPVPGDGRDRHAATRDRARNATRSSSAVNEIRELADNVAARGSRISSSRRDRHRTIRGNGLRS